MESRENLLRQALGINAVISGVTGLVVAVFGGTIDQILETGAPLAVRVVGIGLVGFAVVVWVASRADTNSLVPGGRAILFADVAWVIASVVTVVAGWFSTIGNVVVLAVAAVVGAFAVGEAIGLARLKTVVESEPVVSYKT